MTDSIAKETPWGLCGCGRPARYLSASDMSEPGSCNKRGRCPTYEELREGMIKANGQLWSYQKAINEIDDYFEYAMESKKDQKKVHQILGNLTDAIAH